jgi:hypothetical protein
MGINTLPPVVQIVPNNLSLIASGSYSGTSVTFTGLSSYDDIWILYYGVGWASTNYSYQIMTLNGDTSSNYVYTGNYWLWNGSNTAAANFVSSTGDTKFANNQARFDGPSGGSYGYVGSYHLTNTKTAGYTSMTQSDYVNDANVGSGYYFDVLNGIYTVNSTINSITIGNVSNLTYTGGTYKVYGA